MTMRLKVGDNFTPCDIKQINAMNSYLVGLCNADPNVPMAIRGTMICLLDAEATARGVSIHEVLAEFGASVIDAVGEPSSKGGRA